MKLKNTTFNQYISGLFIVIAIGTLFMFFSSYMSVYDCRLLDFKCGSQYFIIEDITTFTFSYVLFILPLLITIYCLVFGYLHFKNVISTKVQIFGIMVISLLCFSTLLISGRYYHFSYWLLIIFLHSLSVDRKNFNIDKNFKSE